MPGVKCQSVKCQSARCQVSKCQVSLVNRHSSFVVTRKLLRAQSAHRGTFPLVDVYVDVTYTYTYTYTKKYTYTKTLGYLR